MLSPNPRHYIALHYKWEQRLFEGGFYLRVGLFDKQVNTLCPFSSYCTTPTSLFKTILTWTIISRLLKRILKSLIRFHSLKAVNSHSLITYCFPQNVRVRVNFGARSFLYAEGSKHRAAADMWSDSMEDIRQGFSELPFAFELDMDVKDESMDAQGVSKPLPPKPTPLTIPKDSVKGSLTVNVT